jgi:hypothetical protein
VPKPNRYDAGLPRGVPDSISRSLWRAASWTGAIAAAAGAVLGTVVAVVCWFPEAGVAGHPLSAVRAGLLGFLAAQHGGITVDTVPTTLVPLLALSAVVVIIWRAGTALAEVAAIVGERRRRAIVGAGLLQAATYAAACVVLVPMSAVGSTSVRIVPVGLAAFVLGACVGITALIRYALGPWDWLPDVVVRGARGAAGAIAVYLGSGAILVAGSLVMHAGRAMDLSRQVGGGFSGLPIAVLGVLCMPNAAVAASAYLAGPGFAVGSGTVFTAFSAEHGVLPAFPLLGALPSGHGANVFVGAWMLGTVLLAGVITLRLASGDDALRGVAAAALISAPAMALVTWLGGGAVGTGRLRTVGASPWQVGLAVAGEIATVTLLLIAAQTLWRLLSDRDVPAPSGPVGEDAEVDEDELAAVGTTDDD